MSSHGTYSCHKSTHLCTSAGRGAGGAATVATGRSPLVIAVLGEIAYGAIIIVPVPILSSIALAPN